MRVDKLYIANEVQYHEDIPFLKVRVLGIKDNIIHFSTEWPVRELACKMVDFNERFREWN